MASDNNKSLSPPIFPSVSYSTTPGDMGFSPETLSEQSPFFYSRWDNPTVRMLEQTIAKLEGAESAVCFASGMAAISGLFLSQLEQGDHLIVPTVCYPGVAELARDILPKFGIEVTSVDMSDIKLVQQAVTPRTKLLHLETPANPIWRLSDIEALTRLAKQHGFKVSADSTVATPLGTNPLSLGVDFVMHSLTKYMNGHGDALGGVVAGPHDDIAALRRDILVHFGAALSAFDAWLILRGIETLSERMEAHQRNAAMVAAFLEVHDNVLNVSYPGLPSHPQHALARRQMRLFSGMMSFVPKDPQKALDRVADRLKTISYAVSLGKAKSLMFYIPSEEIQATSFQMSEEEYLKYRDWAGDGIFRLSVGLEDPVLICADLDALLRA